MRAPTWILFVALAIAVRLSKSSNTLQNSSIKCSVALHSTYVAYTAATQSRDAYSTFEFSVSSSILSKLISTLLLRLCACSGRKQLSGYVSFLLAGNFLSIFPIGWTLSVKLLYWLAAVCLSFFYGGNSLRIFSIVSQKGTLCLSFILADNSLPTIPISRQLSA